jgi:hypothetical protein
MLHGEGPSDSAFADLAYRLSKPSGAVPRVTEEDRGAGTGELNTLIHNPEAFEHWFAREMVFALKRAIKGEKWVAPVPFNDTPPGAVPRVTEEDT